MQTQSVRVVIVNLMAQAVLFVQNGTLGRACEAVEKVFALVHSPPLEGWQAKPDGVVVKVLNNVTPIDLLAQSAVLFFNSPVLIIRIYLNFSKQLFISSFILIPTFSKQSSRESYVLPPPRKSQNSFATFSSFSKSSIPAIVHRAYGLGS